MAIIDLDSHLRDGWLLDEIYQLPEPFAQYSPKRIGDGNIFMPSSSTIFRRWRIPSPMPALKSR
jgi:hypothetical protein